MESRSKKTNYIRKSQQQNTSVASRSSLRAAEFSDPAVLSPDQRLSHFGRLLLRAIERRAAKNGDPSSEIVNRQHQ